ncbi:hypothetical protein NPIL_197001 [Nephila pilipes]|uniref:Uncharacterized protein n=1 Tax=Nephila pilipes TaxID=299642 RepID=A0A8X6PNU7_NEPPI|nr:hypothetical protein NPIL_197001 [Nephila pilipes]
MEERFNFGKVSPLLNIFDTCFSIALLNYLIEPLQPFLVLLVRWYIFLHHFFSLNNLDMNLNQNKDMESARNMELSDENRLSLDTSITINDSKKKLRNSTKSLRSHSQIFQPPRNLIKNFETDTAFSPDDPFYAVFCEMIQPIQ